MKLLAFFAALAFSFASFASFEANATSLMHTYTQTLNDVRINGEETTLTGVVIVNFSKNEIILNLYEDPCGQLQPPKPGVFRCMAAAHLEDSLIVPLEKKTSSCGSIIYSGEDDRTPVDGFRTTISVADHSARICEDVYVSPVMVEATRFSPRSQITTVFELKK